MRDLGAKLLNASIPKSGYRVTRDIAYGSLPHQRLDLYVPKAVNNAPLVLYFYGGGWTHGDRRTYPFVAEALTSAGIAFAVADYGLYPQARYPSFLDDGAAAFHYVREHATDLGIDGTRLFLAGHSAGAYNAVMLAVNRRYLSDADRASLKGAIGVAGLYDFLPLTSPTMIEIFGGADCKETQPIEYVEGKAAPILLAHGGKDDVVHPGNSRRMARKLAAFGSDVELKEYPNAGHVDIIVSLARGFRRRTTLRDDIVSFVHRHGSS
ncbi:MAG: alpha/beta hydrolase [Alphaproteobacteria bacterium]|nr:alpha/beta hydrolase [Alphaproteobacteria bacterium]